MRAYGSIVERRVDFAGHDLSLQGGSTHIVSSNEVSGEGRSVSRRSTSTRSHASSYGTRQTHA
ncbi:hypothetical protein SESBI_34385 [Sesbania bispinosa]|nr:hypothetical protein SESBI_34385 [Sesbania bispinosa]